MMMFLLLAAALASGKPGELKTFKDWTVGCDNGRACHATSLMPEDGGYDDPLTISIKRGPQPGAPPVIALLGPSGGTYRLGTAKGLLIRLAVAKGASEHSVDPRDLPAALAALRSDATWSVQNTGGKILGEISLAGVSAALLYMDDMQKRVGTATALARPGSRPPSAVPPPPPLPMIASKATKAPMPYRPTDAQIAALRKRHQCEAEDADRTGYEVEMDSLGRNHVLVLLGCGAGAYNYATVAFIATWRGDHFVLAPATYDIPPTAGEGQPMLVNAAWDPDESLLSTFSKGRGLGDCGTAAVYVWDGKGLRLAHQAEMRECRGSMDYITTWRARVVPG